MQPPAANYSKSFLAFDLLAVYWSLAISRKRFRHCERVSINHFLPSAQPEIISVVL